MTKSEEAKAEKANKDEEEFRMWVYRGREI